MRSNKVYEYKGKHYCETDLSLKDELYVGDLYDLYWELKNDGKCYEETRYYCGPYDSDENEAYSSWYDMIESEFESLEIKEDPNNAID